MGDELGAAHPRHAGVGEHDIRQVPREECDGLGSAACLRDHLDPVDRVEQEREPAPHEVLVVDDHDPQRGHLGWAGGSGTGRVGHARTRDRSSTPCSCVPRSSARRGPSEGVIAQASKEPSSWPARSRRDRRPKPSSSRAAPQP